MSDDQQPNICSCKECGKIFYKGQQGDNEEYCLRCERVMILNELEDDLDYETN